jgi:hypothetical protein
MGQQADPSGTLGPVSNPDGHPASLEAARPGNTFAVRHGAYSSRLQNERARAIADQVLAAPHTSQLDEIGAVEIGMAGGPEDHFTDSRELYVLVEGDEPAHMEG